MINQYDLNGHYLKSFPTIAAAAKSFGEDWRKRYPIIYTLCRKSNGTNKSAYGFQWRETEDIADIPPYEKSRRKTGSRKLLAVYQFDLNGVYLQMFDNVKAASEAMNIKPNRIYTACHQNSPVEGFLWRLASKNSPEIEPENIAPYKKKKTTPLTHGGGRKPKSVRQYDFQGKYLKTYDCISDASKENNISKSTITCSCKSKKIGRGFYWMWADESEESDIAAKFDVRDSTNKAKESKAENKEKIKNAQIKLVNQYDLNGHFLQSFSSVQAAAESVDVTAAYIRCACSSCRPAKQYLWRIASDTQDIDAYTEEKKTKAKQTNQYDQNGHFLRSYTSVKEAALSVGTSLVQIARADRLENCIVNGYMWRITKDTSDIEPYVPKKR